mgnify:CR=1 FL=1
MTKEIPKIYDPKQVEDRLYDYWEEHNYFHAEPNDEKEPYTIVIPPPNVTAVLHMGHAYNNAIQDILIRWRRMQGYEALWMPGTDHAGIATQNVVERELLKEGKTRHDIGREEFVKLAWQWSEDRRGEIVNQLKKLGCSCDWDRERFTFDEGLSEAVTHVFVSLYEKGLIYRDSYIVNWCPRCSTVISDEEVEHEQQQGHLWHIRYPIKDSDDFIVVATTRPETMLGDTGIAVNPGDDRYKDMVGKTVMLPILERELPVIEDEYVDPEFGTGMVKVTPAHDPNDFEMGNRHDLALINILNDDATMNENAGPYEGMDRFECREQLVKDLEDQGFLVKREKYDNRVGHCYRCHTIVEPSISDQWFVKMEPLAKPAYDAVNDGRIDFFPEKWVKTYNHWLENIRDWCISRQLWWGHRIPAYYCKDCGHMVVARSKPDACDKCGHTEWRQDEDVLDTWFSSWLWPFSTMDWPEETPELKFFYPTNTLVTAQDIIFFWVARMIMAGLEFMDDIPFDSVYFNGIIRDAQGRKMSKSLGNGIDPLEMVEEFSADAVRYSLIVLSTEGQDINLAEENFEIGRNFSNKLWNSFRFVEMQRENEEISHELPDQENWELADRWIVSRLQRVTERYNEALENFKIHEAQDTVHKFFWGEFCDWYLELMKPRLYGDDVTARATAMNVAVNVLRETLQLLHPIIPFITEEIWQHLKLEDDPDIMVSEFPAAESSLVDEEAESQMNLLQDVIVAIRTMRSEMNVPPSKQAEVFINGARDGKADLLNSYNSYIANLANLETITIEETVAQPESSATTVVREMEIFMPLADLIDLGKECDRLEKEIEDTKGRLRKAESKLANENFVEKAPAEVVEKEREKKATYQEELKKLQNNYEKLIQLDS